jgi:hypothetical protein
VVPTVERDVTFLSNDLGVGLLAFRSAPDSLLSFVIPAVEAHLTTPLNNRGDLDPIFVPDLLTITSGVHIGLFSKSILSFGVATPVTGPRPYEVEAIAQFNCRF